MKFVPTLLAAWVVVAVHGQKNIEKIKVAGVEHGILENEDNAFWDRLLPYYHKSMTPPPEPPKECLVDVEIECVSATTGLECQDISYQEGVCEEEVCYTYTFTNVGTTPMNITVAEREFNGEVNDLLPFIEINPLQPGASTSIEECTVVDVCTSQEFCTTLIGNADSPDGILCQDQADYCWSIEVPPPPPPTPSPTPPPTVPPTPSPTAPCTIDFETTCTLGGTTDCTAIPPAVQQCEGRPLMMGMLYNGGDCSQTYTPQVQDPDKFSCVDLNGGPPTTDGESSYIVVFALKDPEIVYYSGFVDVGTIFYLEDNGNEVAADMNATIYSSDVLTPENTLQRLQFHSSCSQNLFLKDRFGAIQLVEWFNEEQGLISCFANATFDLAVVIPIDIEGDSLTLTSLVSITSWGIFNLTDEVFGLQLAPGETVEASFEVTLDLTQLRRYELLTEIIGFTPEGVECRGVSFYSFSAGVDLNNATLPPGDAGGGKGDDGKGDDGKGDDGKGDDGKGDDGKGDDGKGDDGKGDDGKGDDGKGVDGGAQKGAGEVAGGSGTSSPGVVGGPAKGTSGVTGDTIPGTGTVNGTDSGKGTDSDGKGTSDGTDSDKGTDRRVRHARKGRF